MNWLKGLAIALIALSLGACASVTSRYGNSRVDQKGQAYYLPKGLIQVNVTETAGQFNVTIEGPIMVADARYRLHADLRKAAFSDNDAVVSVDPATQLLTTAQITSTGQAAEIIENLYGVPRSAAGFVGGYTVQIFSGLYEIENLESASEDASKALMEYYQRRCGPETQVPTTYGYDDQDDARDDCERYRELGIDQPGMVSLTLPETVGAGTANDTIGKCGRGLCYRPLVPVKIRAVVAGIFVTEDYYMVPDTTTVSYYTLPSGFFAKQEYTLTFEQGVLVTVDQKQQSELLGFSRLPTEILKGIISAPVDAVLGDRRNRPASADDSAPQGGQLYGTRAFSGPAAARPSYFKTRTIQLGDPANAGASPQAGFSGGEPQRTYQPQSDGYTSQYPGQYPGQYQTPYPSQYPEQGAVGTVPTNQPTGDYTRRIPPPPN